MSEAARDWHYEAEQWVIVDVSRSHGWVRDWVPVRKAWGARKGPHRTWATERGVRDFIIRKGGVEGALRPVLVHADGTREVLRP